MSRRRAPAVSVRYDFGGEIAVEIGPDRPLLVRVQEVEAVKLGWDGEGRLAVVRVSLASWGQGRPTSPATATPAAARDQQDRSEEEAP